MKDISGFLYPSGIILKGGDRSEKPQRVHGQRVDVKKQKYPFSINHLT